MDHRNRPLGGRGEAPLLVLPERLKCVNSRNDLTSGLVIGFFEERSSIGANPNSDAPWPSQ